MSALRVALVVNNLERGGAQSLLLELVERLDRKRFDPVLVYLGKPNAHADWLKERGFEAIFSRVGSSFALKELRVLAEIFAKRKFQIIHAHTDSASFASRLAGLLAPPAYHVAHYHNVYERKLNPAYVRLEQALGPITDQYVACSQAVEDFMRERVELGRYRLMTIVNGITLGPFIEAAAQRAEARAAFGIGDEVLHLVHVARLKPVKRPERILRALAHCEGIGDWRLTYVGDGDERAGLEALARSMGEEFARRVVFVGNRDDVPMWLASADISVLLSDAEGLPISVIEAMASGVCCLVSNIGAMTDVIRDGTNGLVVNHLDEKEIARGVEKLAREVELRRMLGAAAAADAKQYSVESFVGATESMYEELMRRRAPANEMGTLRRRLLLMHAGRLARRAMAEYRREKRRDQ